MLVVDPEKLEWKQEEGWRKAVIHEEKLGDTAVQMDMLEVPAGAQIAPHHHKKRREFHFVVYSGGARLQIGERFFRPTAGQVFECEPGDTMGVVNDTHHALRLMVTKIGYDPKDLHPEPVQKKAEISAAGSALPEGNLRAD
ncbi:MAG: hypothetical protein HY319_14375 [Armatimonadetes bacterium]|nr:hypothetical protein [Armatimonadota bacterium]